ncbi:class I tRNA ligase family protein [Streptomyces sp. NBC_00234]|uniref:class I tRNA ligase family protein n=1 Tax=Streptomyces sp. NBC_00234 TaxID=2903638 RepID=UPI002E29BCCF|nr:class I tRNA ligase family protein [Streptomyces sp. NBC_00234]
MRTTASLWITTTPIATHGELHLGHLAGPYVAADALTRFLRADGESVLFTTGTADHAASVELRALRTGRPPAAVAEGNRAAIEADLRRAGVEFDQIARPRRSAGYRRWVQDVVSRLHAEGIVVPRVRPLPYCEPCGRWLHGAHVTGGCPHCAAPASAGTCRTCGRPNDGGDLAVPRCVLCGTAAHPRRLRRLYLPLEPFRDDLVSYWATAGMPPRIAALCESLAEDGLPDVAVSQPGRWGVPVRVEGFDDHVVDAGFEAVALQLSGHGTVADELPGRAVRFSGAGHAFHEAVLLPALLLEQGVKPAHVHVVGETYRLTEEDGTGLWALDLLNEFGSDTLRRHVLETRAAERRSGFRRDRLTRSRQVLDDTWNTWLNGLFGAVRAENGGLVPAAQPDGAGWDVQLRRLTGAVGDLRQAYGPDAFDPRRAVAVLDEVVRSVAGFGEEAAYERSRPGRGDAYLGVLAAQLSVAAALSAWARPVMPEGADRLAAVLGVPPGRPVTLDALAVPPAGTPLASPTGPVFGF